MGLDALQQAHGITLDGERFELTPELVRARLSDHLPEDIREYWVDIDGVRWPVKQVISIATGVTNRQRFQFQDSRRWLKNLGFPILMLPTLSGVAQASRD